MGSMLNKAHLLGAVVGLLSLNAMAQTRAVSADDYARAERFLGQNLSPLVDHSVQGVRWLDDAHLVYVDADANGARILRMDVASGTAAPAFDHAKLAKALAKATGKPVDAKKLDKAVP